MVEAKSAPWWCIIIVQSAESIGILCTVQYLPTKSIILLPIQPNFHIAIEFWLYEASQLSFIWHETSKDKIILYLWILFTNYIEALCKYFQRIIYYLYHLNISIFLKQGVD